MEKLKNSESTQAEPSSEFNMLEEIPFIGPIPEDLKRIPENVARICLKERKMMNSPENRGSYAFNIFAKDESYHVLEDFNKKTPGFKEIIDSPDFWQSERAELQDYGIKCQFENAVKLSESMRSRERELGIPPTIYTLSGISAAGKTTACKNADYPGMLYDIKPNGEKGNPIGPLATDNSKDYLWMAGGSCDQIHAESSMMMRKIDNLWREYVQQKNGDCSEVRDKTFSEIKDVKGIIKNARETNRRICDLDIDVPFIVSAVGVMMRPKGSHEPHPAFDYLKDNYALMKITRLKKLGNLYPNSELDVDYSLKCYDYNSNPKERQKEAAHYEKGPDGKTKLVITNQELFNKAIARKENAHACREEADQAGNQLLTKEFIEEYCQKYINSGDEGYINSVKNALSVYLEEDNPRTIRDILDENANA